MTAIYDLTPRGLQRSRTLTDVPELGCAVSGAHEPGTDTAVRIALALAGRDSGPYHDEDPRDVRAEVDDGE